MRSVRAGTPVLLVDNGDVNRGYGRQPELKYETAMKAMAEMGYAAANVGEQDLILGVDYLKYVSDFTGVPLVSANITAPDGNVHFEPYAVHEVNVAGRAVQTAIVGIISTDFKGEIEEVSPECVVEEYESRLEQLLDELKAEADLFILLAHMGEPEARLVAKRFPQFAMLIVSHSGEDPNIAPDYAGDAPVLFAGTKGMHVGVARFRLEDDAPTFTGYTAEKLEASVGEARRMLVLLDEYQQMVRAENLLGSYPRSVYGSVEFTGNKSCGRCHSLSTFRFRKDKHAHAFDSITEKGHEYDPECVRCHTVGFGYVSGFITPEKTPELKHVGCEDCHGPGSLHVEDPRRHRYDEVTRETCETCHNPDNSPKFVYEEYLEKIKHNSFFLCSAKICHWFD